MMEYYVLFLSIVVLCLIILVVFLIKRIEKTAQESFNRTRELSISVGRVRTNSDFVDNMKGDA